MARKSSIIASVVTIHHDDHERLKILKSALEKQTFNLAEFEWIVVDDKSYDGPPEFFDNVKEEKLNIVPVKLRKNSGRAAARNAGWKKARGQFIAFVDADIEVTPTWLEILIRDAQLTNAIIVGRLRPHPDLEQNSYLRYYHTRGGEKIEAGQKIPGKYFTTGSVCIPTELLKESGGFDENFSEWGGEDLELGLRLERDFGASFYFERRALAFHYHDREWSDVKRLYLSYGINTVPELIKSFPDAKELLTLHLLDKRQEGIVDKIKSCIIKNLLRETFYKFFEKCVIKYPTFPFPDKIFDFMIFYLYSRHFVNTLEISDE